MPSEAIIAVSSLVSIFSQAARHSPLALATYLLAGLMLIWLLLRLGRSRLKSVMELEAAKREYNGMRSLDVRTKDGKR